MNLAVRVCLSVSELRRTQSLFHFIFSASGDRLSFICDEVAVTTVFGYDISCYGGEGGELGTNDKVLNNQLAHMA